MQLKLLDQVFLNIIIIIGLFIYYLSIIILF